MQGFLRLPAVMLLAGATQFVGAQTAPSTGSSTPSTTPAQTPQSEQKPDGEQAPAPPKGQVLFQSHGDAPEAPDQTGVEPLPAQGADNGMSSSSSSNPGEPDAAPAQIGEAEKPTGPELSDAERSALTITGYDLDARLTPARSRLAMRAVLTVRNDGKEPMTRLALQVSSTLKWDSVSLVTPAGTQKLAVAQHLLETDTDHTGRANELVLALPAPLAPGGTLKLDAFYSGAVTQNGSRLARIGANATQAADADWDSAGPREIALRGFGDVLWYPVSSPQYFLGQGNELFEAIGRMRLREAQASVRLRLAVEFQGEAPVAAYFNGRRAELKAISDNADAPVATNAGIATTEFAAEPMGYRALSLFVLSDKETLTAALPLGVAPPPPMVTAAPMYSAKTESSSAAGSSAAGASAAAAPVVEAAKPEPVVASETEGRQGPPLLAVSGASDLITNQLRDAAENVAPVIQDWFGTHPLSALTIVDHRGQAFEDGPLVVAPAAALASREDPSALVYSMAHAWVQTGQPWIDEGLSGFASLVVTESQHDRDTAIAQLNDLLRPLLIAEPEFDSQEAANAPDAAKGQPLIAATSEVYYRRKAAAVFWMLRSLIGDEALSAAIKTLVTEPPSHGSAEEQAVAFEKLLEKTGTKDLSWLFHDWVLNDPGLPDLSFIDVTPRSLPAGKGHDSGWLVAVSVKNDGGATADVPVVVRSGNLTHADRMRIPPYSQAVVRILVEGAPTQVLLNDGSVPEVRTSQHIRTLDVAPK
ncbi:hypothetical protein SAMN05421819_3950 [Bryocella elongata]|uniref:Peptidase M1 membrane alanine aminopeptidase domain-containing protein n=1 Tax=Bryocella elongata TaxID=863522 RepID=A0A1H6BR24_9BACT|nr:hypothetical protein [Bryocella elongata]SEG63158.1 hypothetical protein SAMN05421819_3950 [Bryocella elongata]